MYSVWHMCTLTVASGGHSNYSRYYFACQEAFRSPRTRTTQNLENSENLGLFLTIRKRVNPQYFLIGHWQERVLIPEYNRNM